MKLDRLISILVVLLKHERVKTSQLANMFNVSTRTILRDIDAINLAGIPIVSYQGANGGISIADGYRLDKSVLNNDEMAAIITTLRSTAAALAEDKHNILIEKFKNTLSSSQLEALNAKTNQLVIDLSPWGENTLLRQKTAEVRKAIENLKMIELVYTDASGNITHRCVEPYSLILKGQSRYLYAWCNTRQAFRLFKLSRIKELRILDTCFSPRAFSVENTPWENEWKKKENVIELELSFEKELETIVQECFEENAIIHTAEKITVTVRIPENDWLYGFILSFGSRVEVVRPQHIRKIIGETARDIYKKYL